MSRFLFVVPPLVGHVNPAVGVAAELAARGHRIAWAGLPEVIGPLAARPPRSSAARRVRTGRLRCGRRICGARRR